MEWISDDLLPLWARLAGFFVKGSLSTLSRSVLIGIRYLALKECLLSLNTFCISVHNDYPKTMYLLKVQQEICDRSNIVVFKHHKWTQQYITDFLIRAKMKSENFHVFKFDKRGTCVLFAGCVSDQLDRIVLQANSGRNKVAYWYSEYGSGKPYLAQKRKSDNSVMSDNKRHKQCY